MIVSSKDFNDDWPISLISPPHQRLIEG